MSLTVAPIVADWLAEATRGLSGPDAALARAELAAHIEDAVDDYLSEGLPPAEALALGLRVLRLGRKALYGLDWPLAGLALGMGLALPGMPITHLDPLPSSPAQLA